MNHSKFSIFNHIKSLGSAESDNTRYLQQKQYEYAVYFSKNTRGKKRDIKFKNNIEPECWTFYATVLNHTSTLTTLKSDTQLAPYVARCLQLKFLVCLHWRHMCPQLGLLHRSRMISFLILSYWVSMLFPDMFTGFMNDIRCSILYNCKTFLQTQIGVGIIISQNKSLLERGRKREIYTWSSKE